jgi:glycine/D-amino acid oxidase-like deaminating enzyme
MTSSHSYEVAIIGAGVTGLATAFFLAKLGFKKILVFSDPNTEAESARNPGLLFGGMFDNFSRISHNHGLDFGAELWNFGDESYEQVVGFARKHGVPHICNERLRLITSIEELREAETAVELLHQKGFDPRIEKLSRTSYKGTVLAVQRDSHRGGWLASSKFLDSLRKAGNAHFSSEKVTKVSTERGGVSIFCGAGEHARKVRSQVLVLASHLGIAELLPFFKSVLVPVASQWLKVGLDASFPLLAGKWLSPGSAFSCNNTYEWGGVLPHSLVIGGANYLRPLAGIGQEQASKEERIATHLIHYAAKAFALHEHESSTPAAKGHLKLREDEGAGLDIRPCDELPVIGPLFGEDRILLAAGFMGQGLTLGFNAGRCLASLIAKGEASSLPRRLWPERLRSLVSTTEAE